MHEVKIFSTSAKSGLTQDKDMLHLPRHMLSVCFLKAQHARCRLAVLLLTSIKRKHDAKYNSDAFPQASCTPSRPKFTMLIMGIISS